jgi:CheY-like chemotaxis protein
MKVPVIVAVTGDSNKEQQEKAKKAGMKLMVSKPISSKDLKNLLIKYGII